MVAQHLPMGCTYSSEVVRDSPEFDIRICLVVCAPSTSNANAIHGWFVGKEKRPMKR